MEYYVLVHGRVEELPLPRDCELVADPNIGVAVYRCFVSPDDLVEALCSAGYTPVVSRLRRVGDPGREPLLSLATRNTVIRIWRSGGGLVYSLPHGFFLEEVVRRGCGSSSSR